MTNLTIHYSATADLYNNSNIPETLGLTIDLEYIEDFDAALEDLRERVHSNLNSFDRYANAKKKITDIESKLEEMSVIYAECLDQYNKMTNFMKAQGIKNDFPEFPPLSPKIVKALPSNEF
ncbi:hypothetical protein [Cyanothece sp. BG0011]|uniref:hypothetical protein n=1 Tax=Cyanothece sp. BG0011 TaxID=2082950 RepID=UPI001300A4AF|nr:hypothetical protein [Cyanothece sp. BG0011]